MYTNSVDPEVLEAAKQAGLIDELGHITRDICMCDAEGWGSALHASACPVSQYYQDGGLRAEKVLIAALEGQRGKGKMEEIKFTYRVVSMEDYLDDPTQPHVILMLEATATAADRTGVSEFRLYLSRSQYEDWRAGMRASVEAMQ